MSRTRFPVGLDRVAKGQPTAAPSGTTAALPPSQRVLRPQRHLHEAARDAARQSVPQGLGLDSSLVRQRMVERLARGGLREPAVVQAMHQVPRHAFVDPALVQQAYEDTALPIGHGQTISKPSVVGRMLELLHAGLQARSAGTLGRVLEIGTGCGYQTALLAQMSRQVVSIERIGALFDKAREHLSAWRLDHVRLVLGDGMLGHAPLAPYDTIVAAAGGDALPPAWLDQLAVGGRLVAPLAPGAGRGQVLVVIDRHAHGLVRTEHEAVHFVPLRSGTA